LFVSSKNNHTIVVAVAPGPIRTDGNCPASITSSGAGCKPWRESVNSILLPFLPGEQYGNAIADLIFGDVVPQAKLPVTLPLHENDQGFSILQWPGVPSKEFAGHLEVQYSEKQIHGYRWYDTTACTQCTMHHTLHSHTICRYDQHNVAPAFPFGFGLTYGKLLGPEFVMKDRTLSYTLRRATSPLHVLQYGANPCETVQFYFSYPDAATDPTVPPKVLRHFEKVCFTTGGPDELTVSYAYTDRDVSSWDLTKKEFVVTKGKFVVHGLTASQGGDAHPSLTFVVA
jgi:beta-glucosidase